MTFAIIRGDNGRRHEVDFRDDPITIEVGTSDAAVQIVVEAPEDLAPSHKRLPDFRIALATGHRRLSLAFVARQARTRAGWLGLDCGQRRRCAAAETA